MLVIIVTPITELKRNYQEPESLSDMPKIRELVNSNLNTGPSSILDRPLASSLLVSLSDSTSIMRQTLVMNNRNPPHIQS